MIIKTLVKNNISSTKGINSLLLEDGRIVIFNADKCRKIKGLDDYVGSWLGNNVRVFTPCIISLHKKYVGFNFTAEKILFVAETITKDFFCYEIDKDWFDESKIIQVQQSTCSFSE